jgi:signal peptidase I
MDEILPVQTGYNSFRRPVDGILIGILVAAAFAFIAPLVLLTIVGGLIFLYGLFRFCIFPQSTWAHRLAALAVMILFYAAIRAWLIAPYKVRGEHMLPSFYSGQRILVSKIIFRLKRGDIVLFKQQQKTLIYRIVAEPGDTLEAKDDGIWAGGTRLQAAKTIPGNLRNYLQKPDLPGNALEFRPGIYGVASDNTDASGNRSWLLVSRNLMFGKVLFKLPLLDGKAGLPAFLIFVTGVFALRRYQAEMKK